MLDFKDIYHKIIEEHSPEIQTSELLDNAEDFIKDCKNNGQYVRRLTKAILADGFKNVKDNKDKLRHIIGEHNLSITINEEGEIKYEKEKLNEILNLLLEHYVTSDLTDKKMLAKAIEKYE